MGGRVSAPLVAAIVATLLCAGLYTAHRARVLPMSVLERAELATLDARFKLRGPRAPVGDEIVVVALDEETRARAPEIFQKRAGWAKLLVALAGYAPAAVGIDGFFDSPEIVLPDEVIAQVQAARGVAGVPSEALAALDAVLEETRGDDKLAKAVAQAGNVYLGALLFLDGAEPAPAGVAEPPALRGARFDEVADVPGPSSRRPPAAARRLIAPIAAIGQAARGAGLLNVLPDDDGAVRRAYAVVQRGDRFYAPLGLVLARARLGTSLSYVAGDTELRLGELSLPVDSRGRAQLDYLGPAATFPQISAADVLEGKTPRAALAGKLVLVGYTDAARDKIETPFDPLYPGVELHATLLHNVLHGELLTRVGVLPGLAAILLLGLAITLLMRTRQSWLVVVVAAAVVLGYLITANYLFVHGRLILDVAAPLTSFALITLASLASLLVVEGREKQRIRAAFSQYLDDRAVKQVLADPSRLELGGERRELTVLFSDIRGFTQWAEKLEPEQVIDFLNKYFTPMTELVWSSGGMLDKYIGDAVMAIYGAPLTQADHAARACRAALAMQARITELNSGWRDAGLPEIAVGIGLNTGAMSVGNMGSARRKNYTVVGDAVNLGSRLEALTKTYGVQVLVGERTRELAGPGFAFREIDLVRVRGKDRPVRVYELIGEEPRDGLGFAAALEHYRRGEWEQAEAGFAAIVTSTPDDGAARTFLARVRALRENGGAKAWDGVWEQK